ncbi:MAG TPA: hypothetical protein VGL34_03410 [Steroidobacteraceae bacterium]|jgi:hypothetical protein
MISSHNTDAVRRLATLVRELAAREDYRHVCHYAHLLATLQGLHDDLAAAKGTPAYGVIQGEAIRVFKACRKYAGDHSFEGPNAIMLTLGYDYFAQG